MSVVTVRASAWVGEKNRRNSSIALSSSERSSGSCCRTSGCWYSHTTVLLVSDAVVPTPPESSRSTMREHLVVGDRPAVDLRLDEVADDVVRRVLPGGRR